MAEDGRSGVEGVPLSKTEYVLQRLRSEIAAGEIPPGMPLRQVEIATRLGVSPTPVREALRLLESDGLVAYAPHKGATVSELGLHEIEDLYALRARIEGLAVRLAVERGTIQEDELLKLGEVQAELRSGISTLSASGRSILNRRFHFLLYSESSKLVSDQIDYIWKLYPSSVTLWDDRRTARIFLKQHDELLDAVRREDPEGSEEAMVNHVLTASRIRLELSVS